MSVKPRIVAAMVFALMLAIAPTANAGVSATYGNADDTLKVLIGTPPDSLDPQVAFTTQGDEADWLVNTPLLTYKHVSGAAGGVLIPGLASALPKVSTDGRTYELSLRKGLKYSNGVPVKASDFAYTIERAIKLDWGGKSFFTGNIEGAAAYDAGEANSISGIVADDKTGQITIQLSQPFGAFSNVLAFPAAGLVPSGTPIKELGTEPPPGVGPYKFTRVDAEGGYTLKRNERFANFNIPGIPTGYADKIKVSVVPDSTVETELVLNNQADVFDSSDAIPPALLPQVERKAGDRFAVQPSVSTFFFFLNTTRPPFNNLKAREAVNTALDRAKLVGFSSFVKPSCFFIPEGLLGHPTGPCPFGEAPDIAKARQLVQESGLAGTPVTVWGQERKPRREYADYLTDMLNQIGFAASEHIVADGEYFDAIGAGANDPQTGFGDWFQDFPNPSDFYLLMDGHSIQPTGNLNWSKVNDPFIQERLLPLNEVPSTQLSSVAGQWQALDEYVAHQAYIAPFGEQEAPQLYSRRIDFRRAVFQVLFSNDFSTLRLK
jgi:peptide/nickel transport system substrate-binding protein